MEAIVPIGGAVLAVAILRLAGRLRSLEAVWGRRAMVVSNGWVETIH
jgi:hypothetical protein